MYAIFLFYKTGGAMEGVAPELCRGTHDRVVVSRDLKGQWATTEGVFSCKSPKDNKLLNSKVKGPFICSLVQSSALQKLS